MLVWPIASQCFLWVFTIKYTVFLPFKAPSNLQSKRLSQWSEFRSPSWQQRALSTRHQAGLIKKNLCILFHKDFLPRNVGVQLQQVEGFWALKQMNESSKGEIYFVSYFIVWKQLNSPNQLFHRFLKLQSLRKWLLYFCIIVGVWCFMKYPSQILYVPDTIPRNFLNHTYFTLIFCPLWTWDKRMHYSQVVKFGSLGYFVSMRWVKQVTYLSVSWYCC